MIDDWAESILGLLRKQFEQAGRLSAHCLVLATVDWNGKPFIQPATVPVLLPSSDGLLVDKDLAALAVAECARKLRALAAAFVSEAWLARTIGEDEFAKLRRFQKRESLEKYPGRVEVLMVSLSRRDRDLTSIWIASIERDRKDRVSRLGPWRSGEDLAKESGADSSAQWRSEGRFTGLVKPARLKGTEDESKRTMA